MSNHHIEIIKEIEILFIRISLSPTWDRKYEHVYKLFNCILNNHEHILKYMPQFYFASDRKCKELYFELTEKKYNRGENLKKLLLKAHEKYIDNYILTINFMPSCLPLDLKKYITSYIIQ